MAVRGLRVAHNHCWVVAIVLLAAMPVRLSAQQPKRCNAQSIFQQSDALLKQKNFTQAQKTLDRLRGCSSLTPLATFNLGWQYGRARDFKRALAILQSSPENLPDPVTHRYAIALTEFELDDYNGAIQTLAPLQANGTIDAKCANLMSVSYVKMGLYRDAYLELSQEIQRDPSDLSAHLNLITLFADTGNFAKAAEAANRTVHDFPNRANVLVVEGSVNTLMGKLQEAHTDFQRAVELSPKQAGPRFFLALSDYKQNNYATAASGLQSAIASGIVDSDLHYLLAECYLKLDPTAPRKALLELDRAIAIHPGSVSARVLRGKLLLEGNHPKQAIADLSIAHRIDAGSRSAIYNLARAYSMTGNALQAETLLKQLNTGPSSSLSELSDRKLKESVDGDAAQ